MSGFNMVHREAVYNALLTQLKTAPLFRTFSRRWKAVYDDPAQRLPLLPMMVLYEQTEDVVWTNRGIGPVRFWGVKLEIYGKIPPGLTGPPGTPDKETPGASVLNPLIDAVEQALYPVGPDGVLTLGDLVTDCRIEGTILKVLGDEDPSGECGAIIPIKILIP